MGKKILTIETIKERLNEINPNIEIFGEFEKETGKTKKRIKRFMKCCCKIDDHEWDSELSNLFSGRGCPECRDNVTRLNINEIKNRLKTINPNIEILSDVYINAQTELKCKCLVDGYIWNNTWNALQQGKGCAKCANKAIPTLDEIKEKLKNINPNIEILSDKYITAQTKLKCRCIVDEHIWGASWNSLQQGYGCPECRVKNMSGENNLNWNGGISKLQEFARNCVLQWKKDSFKAYKYKCVVTGSNKNILIHHLCGFDKILQETMEILSLPIYKEINRYTEKELKSIGDLCLELHYKYGLGVCLCEEEHRLFHSSYGYGDNTSEQFKEFKKTRHKQLNIKSV